MADGNVHAGPEEIMRAYGVLATSLTETLGEARQALEPHANLLPDGTLAELDTVLAEFARRRIRIAVYGEVKAGKSTLINAVVGAVLSPAAFDPLTSVPIRITYGAATRWHVGNRSFEDVAELTRMMRDGVDADEVVAETNLDLLQLGGQLDLLDTPGVGSEERFDAISEHALRSLDAVVLVVRYPALFTRFTRHLMQSLQTDIGKLFVVWNLDADCAELTDEERRTHAETLRTNVAGAHELYLVDARAALQAARDGSSEGRAASGLEGLSSALSRFASSGRREIAALREAAKRAQQWLDDAEERLAGRHEKLEGQLTQTRAELRQVQESTDGQTAKVRAQHGQLQARAREIGDGHTAKGQELAATLRKHLRAARRHWIRNGDFVELEQAAEEATKTYASGSETASRTANDALRNAARTFGTTLTTSARPRTQPNVEPLAPGERMERQASGRLRGSRRLLWRRWYLPGLEELLTTVVDRDVASQTEWFQATLQNAEKAAAATRDAKLAEIESRGAAELDRIKAEKNFADNEAEFEALGRHLPIVRARRQSATDINTQALALIAE
jgi:predicted GTPase